jgi:hypothetical protein
MVGLLGLVSAACVAPAPSAPYYGIYFSAPNVGYIGQSATLKPTATSKLPVQLTLDATSSGCTLDGYVVSYDSLGTCVINANEPGDATHAASNQIQRKIAVVNCPPLRGGIWSTTILGTTLSAPIDVVENQFSGTVNLSSLNLPNVGVVSFSGYVDCQVAHMTFNGVLLSGVLSYDGSSLSSTYQGISIVLHAPPAAG